MDVLSVITVLIIISAAFSYLNERFIKLPDTIGVVTISVVVSLVILLVGKSNISLTNTIATMAHNIDFSKVLLDVMLGFLLFASALHFNYRELKEQRLPVFMLSTLGVVISAGVFGGLFYLTSLLLHLQIPLIYCFLFGSLISPTDPIAVGAILKDSIIPPRLNTIISGESLFNDGVGLIIFVIILSVAEQSHPLSFIDVLELFAREVLGGILIGSVTGYFAYRLIKSIKNYQNIFLISIALVLVISVIADKFHASIPLSAVTAGLIIGNRNTDKKNIGDEFLKKIWELLDQILNTILFVMIGLQLVTMPFLSNYWLIGLLSIIILLIARIISVLVPALFLLRKVSINNLSILTWAGLRGGISIAMALRLPVSPYKEIILASCYIIVIFSIIVQGLTLNKVVEKAAGKQVAQ